MKRLRLEKGVSYIIWINAFQGILGLPEAVDAAGGEFPEANDGRDCRHEGGQSRSIPPAGETQIFFDFILVRNKLQMMCIE